MTFKELLNSVTFDKVAEYLIKNYHETEYSIGWFKIHFDMLRLMQPKHHDNMNSDVCHITMMDWEDGTGKHLHAFPLEGDYWEHSLTKELIIAPDVKATNAEIAACCIFHTSFYGFTEKQVHNRFRFYDVYNIETKGRLNNKSDYEILANQNFEIIRRNGGYIPPLRVLSPTKKKALKDQILKDMLYREKRISKIKKKMLFRKKFLENYYERMLIISDFVVKAIPALKSGRNYISVDELCRLFKSESFCSVEIPSFAEENIDSATYILEIVQKYIRLRKMENLVLYLARGYDYHVIDSEGTVQEIRPEERVLYDTIYEKFTLSDNRGTGDLIIDVIPELGHQTIIDIVCYNGKPIAE